MEMESPSVLRSPRPAARGLRLSSSFKPLSEAARASGATTPTGILLGKASDIITSKIEHGCDEECTTPNSVAWSNSTGRKLRSCLSLGRHSDSPVPPASAAAACSAEHKGLHWKPEPVAVSAADQSLESHDSQARCLKMEAELQESEAARALLQKQLRRVQDAMKQSRTNLEDAQRAALAAEAKTAAVEAQAASLLEEVRQLHTKLAESNTQVHHAVHKLPHWSECLQLAQHMVATPAGQQPWTARLHKQRAGVTAGLSATAQLPVGTARHGAGQLTTAQAQGNTTGLSAVRQVPGSIGGHQATRQVPGSTPEPFPGCAKQHHTVAAQTQSVAALQRIANTVPSWAETTLPDHPGAPHHHGFLASAVMLETLGRQKQTQALSLHASSPKERGGMEPKHNETHRGSRQGLASPGSKLEGVHPERREWGSTPESPISHKYLWLLQSLTACSHE